MTGVDLHVVTLGDGEEHLITLRVKGELDAFVDDDDSSYFCPMLFAMTDQNWKRAERRRPNGDASLSLTLFTRICLDT